MEKLENGHPRSICNYAQRETTFFVHFLQVMAAAGAVLQAYSAPPWQEFFLKTFRA